MGYNFAQIAVQKVKQKASELGKTLGYEGTQGGNVQIRNNSLVGNLLSGTQRASNMMQKPEQNLWMPQALAQGKMQTGIKPVDYAGQRMGSYIQNMYVNSLKQIPGDVQNLATNKPVNIGGYQVPKVLNPIARAGKLGLDVLGAIPDPTDYLLGVANFAKGTAVAKRENKGFLGSLDTQLKAMTYEKPVGLGEAVTTNPTGQMIGNLAELPLMIFMGGRIAKSKQADTLIKQAQPEIEQAVMVIKKYDQFQPPYQMAIYTQAKELANKFLPQVVKSKEMRRLETQNPKRWLDTIGTFLEDRLVIANHPEMNVGLKTRAIQRLDGTQATKGGVGGKMGEMGIPKEYQTAETQIKKFVPNAKSRMVDSIAFPGSKSVQIGLPSGGEVSFDVRPKEIVVWSAGNVGKAREPKMGSGEATKVIRSLMALAKDENKNIHILAPTGGGYWEHLGFKNAGGVPSTGLTPKDLAKIPKLSEFSPQPEGGVGVSSRKGNYKAQLDQDVAQISKPELEKQLRGGISTRTKATGEVSSEPIIPEKGKLNINRLKVQGEGKQVLKDINKKVKPTIIGNKEVIAQARTAKGTGALNDDQMKKLLASQLKNRQQVVDLSVRFNQAKQNGATEVELGKIMLDMSNQSKVARQGSTFAGRLLQAQNIIADQSASPTQKILALLDNAGIAPEKYLKDAVKVNWDNPNEVVAFYRKYVPPKFGELLDEYRYSNMLSSPLTHIINTASNALQTGIVAPVEKTISGVLDWGKSTLTGSERQYYARSGIDYAGGYAKALPQAFKKAWKVLSGSEVLTKPDFERVPLGTTGIKKAFSTPLRALEAMDQFFKTLVEGGVTAELKKGPRKLPLSQIADKASKEANYRLFRQAFDPNGELGQGAVLKMFDKWNSAIANLRRLPGGRWVLPFLQTPTNILKQGIEYSPLGAATAIGAKAPIEQLSKTIIGTGVFIGAYQLAKNGLTTWESPSSETERELYYAAGMQPYSVKIGDKWVSFSKLGPLSYPIAMAAALASAEKNNPDKSTISNISSGMSGILGFFGDQSYVRSIGDLVDAIQGGINIGPNAMAGMGANLAGQLIPYRSFLTWLGRTIDPTYRKASSFGERMAKDLPIVGSNLKPYEDIYGQPSKRDYPVLNAVSPYKITQEKPQEAGMLEKYQEGKINRAVEKRADEAFTSGDKNAQVSGKIFRYIDDTGALKKIDTSTVTSLPDSTPYEKAIKEKKAYSLADNVLELPPDQQAAVFALLGISPEDAVYYNTAKQDNRLKSLYIDEEIGKLDSSNRANMINFLISQRKEVNGDMVLSNTNIGELEDKGLISTAEATMLKNLKIVDGKPVTKLTGRGKKVSLKKVSLPTSAKIKVRSMASLLKTKKLKVKRYKFKRSFA